MTESYYEQARALGASPSLIAGLDMLDDDGMPYEKAAELLVAAERQGQDPEAFARHVLKLRKAIR